MMQRKPKQIRNAGHWAVLTGATLCLSATTGVVGPVQAQNAATLKAFATEKHLGTPEQALVGVEVRDDNGALFGWGSGLVLRCDGFVAVPASICAYGKNSKLHLTIVLYPGTEKEVRKPAPWPYFGKFYRDEYAFPIGYTVAHVPNVHLPALRVATADVLHNSDKVKLVWTERDEKTGRFSLPQQRDMTLARAEAYPKDLTKFTPGGVLLTDAQSGVPAGAVAVGPEALGVGMVIPAPVLKGESAKNEKDKTETNNAESNGASRFQSFSVLERVSNCVSPITMTDAEFAKRHPVQNDDDAPNTAGNSGADTNVNAAQAKTVTAQSIPGDDKVATDNPPANSDGNIDANADKAPEVKDSEAMVTVSGGPILLPQVVQSLQPDMGNATVACVAPFLIDKYEVTNRQYAAFWNSLPATIKKQKEANPDYWPYGWATNGPAFPPDVDDVPVIGVRLVGAQAYAKWAGKRLPTPYEWCLAAFGPKGMSEPPEWVKNYVADRQQTWQTIQQAHSNFLQSHPELLVTYNRHVIEGPRRIVRIGKRNVEIGSNDYVDEPVQHSLDEPGAHSFVPWLFPVKDERSIQADANTFSQQTIDNATKHLWDVWKEPINLLPVGSRDFDKSPYGAMDMILNADELVWPGPTWPAGPSQIPDHYIHVGWQGYPAAMHFRKIPPLTPPPYDFLGTWQLDQVPFLSPLPIPLPDVALYMTSVRGSRLLLTQRPNDIPPDMYFTEILTLLAITEAGEIGRPILSWKIQMVQGPVYFIDSGTANILFIFDNYDLTGLLLPFWASATFHDYDTVLHSWGRPSQYWRTEMGRMPYIGQSSQPLNGQTTRRYDMGDNITLYNRGFVIAGGFRCAR